MHTCFPEIAFVLTSVHPSPRPQITSGVIWTLNDWFAALQFNVMALNYCQCNNIWVWP